MGIFSSSSTDNIFLGIDIGDSSLKIVELRKKNKKVYLSNYGFSEDISNVKLINEKDIQYLIKVIDKVKRDIGIIGKQATASLPTFSVFSSIINIHNIDKKNIAERINTEAKKVIPLPLSEMVLDWKIIPSKSDEKKDNVRVFLTGSPKKLVQKYIDIFKGANVTLISLETETFSLVRALIGRDKSIMMIVEVGANSTDLSIVKEGIPVLSRSINICGRTITEAIKNNLGISSKQAEQIKLDLSSAYSIRSKELPKVIMESITPIVNEIKYMMDLFQNNNNEVIEKIILSGGGALLLNFSEYLSHNLNMKVIVGDPWSRIIYPAELKPVLTELAPKLSVAVGLALREAE